MASVIPHRSVFLISPVNRISPEEIEFLDGYVADCARNGVKVHFPYRHTKQDGDQIGTRILSENREALRDAHVAEIYYNPTSAGSAFDLGAAYMAEKPVSVINPGDVMLSSGEVVSRFLRIYALRHMRSTDVEFVIDLDTRRERILQSPEVVYRWSRTTENLFDFGMAYMAEKPVVLLNRDEVKPTPHKSFENVLLALHDKTLS